MKKILFISMFVFSISAFAQVDPLSIKKLSTYSIAQIKKSFISIDAAMKVSPASFSNSTEILRATSIERLDSSYSAGWDPYNNIWGYSPSMKIYEYGSTGMVKNVLTKQFQNGVWDINKKDIYTYNAKANLTSTSTQFYYAGTWYETAKQENTYDTSGNLTNSIFYQIDFNTLLLVPKNQYLIVYDANNNPTEMTNQEFIADAWVTNSQNVLTYDTNGNMTTSLNTWWSDAEIASGEKYIATYNASNEIDAYSTQSWNAITKTWDNSSRLINFTLEKNNPDNIRITQESMGYSYNPIFINNKTAFSSYTQQSWINNTWVDASMYVPVFDANNNLISATIKGWNKTAWTDNIKWSCTYDANNKLISSTHDTWNVVYWAYRRTYITYDANNNVTSNVKQTFQNATVYDWVMAATTYTTYTPSNKVISQVNKTYLLDGKMIPYSGDTIYNYYSNAPAGTKDIRLSDNTISVYPNPSNGNIKINSSNTPISSIEIFDLEGRKIYFNTQINPQMSTEVDLRTVTKGIYFLRVNNKESTAIKILLQ